ncbi:MAG: radical SAM family heme chaperone HemW, partial [Bacteroidales bacterium]|nr:radical SAM family heme chaperone HemW [Bacteroidales bacterium]
MSGLYIHIPYCKQRCIYCDFYSSATREDKKTYIECLIKEFEQRKSELTQKIETIYFGGGTPSILTKDELSFLLTNILKQSELFNLSEITLEANPENLTFDYLEFLKKNTPINRLSIGIQSFNNQDLKILGRKHSAEEAIKAVKASQELGLDNISIDLMFNLPNMTKEKWLKNLQTAINLNIQHISAYSLTVEEGTMLHTLIDKQKLTLPTEKQQIEQFDLTIEFLTKNGFEHYETSNYASLKVNDEWLMVNGWRSKHNSSYWNNTPYLGLGASAHSFDGEERSWNISDLKEYISRIKNNQPLSEKETLTEKDKYNEYILVGTRIKEGLNPDYIKTN